MADFYKEPSEVLDFDVNWSNWLQAGETISTSTWTVESGITKDSDSFTDAVATIWLSGGSDGIEYDLTNEITTSGGRTGTEDVTVLVTSTPPIPGITLAELVALVADTFGHYRSGTAESGSDADTLIDTGELFEPDDYWIGHYVYIVDAGDAAPEGELRPVTDYDQSEGEITVSPAFTAAIAADDEYEILPLRRDRIVRAINQAIRHADRWLQTATDTDSITISDEDYDYALPTGVVRVAQAWTREDTDQPWVEISPNAWRVLGEPGQLTLYLDTMDGVDDGYAVRLEYLKQLDMLSVDEDSLGLDGTNERDCVDFIVNYALYWLYAQQASAAPQSDAFRSYLTLAEYKREAAEMIREKAGRHSPAGRVHGAYPARSKG